MSIVKLSLLASNITSVRKLSLPTSADPKISRRGAKNEFQTPGAYTLAFEVAVGQVWLALLRMANPVSPYILSTRSVAVAMLPMGSVPKEGGVQGAAAVAGAEAGATAGAGAARAGGAGTASAAGDGAAGAGTGGEAALGTTAAGGGCGDAAGSEARAGPSNSRLPKSNAATPLN